MEWKKKNKIAIGACAIAMFISQGLYAAAVVDEKPVATNETPDLKTADCSFLLGGLYNHFAAKSLSEGWMSYIKNAKANDKIDGAVNKLLSLMLKAPIQAQELLISSLLKNNVERPENEVIPTGVIENIVQNFIWRLNAYEGPYQQQILNFGLPNIYGHRAQLGIPINAGVIPDSWVGLALLSGDTSIVRILLDNGFAASGVVKSSTIEKSRFFQQRFAGKIRGPMTVRSNLFLAALRNDVAIVKQLLSMNAEPLYLLSRTYLKDLRSAKNQGPKFYYRDEDFVSEFSDVLTANSFDAAAVIFTAHPHHFQRTRLLRWAEDTASPVLAYTQSIFEKMVLENDERTEKMQLNYKPLDLFLPYKNLLSPLLDRKEARGFILTVKMTLSRTGYNGLSQGDIEFIKGGSTPAQGKREPGPSL